MDRQECEQGTLLVELMAAMSITTIALMSLLMVLVTTSQLQTANDDRTVAANAAQDMIERMQNEPFNTIYARFNADPNDDPDGPGTAPGGAFAVAGLSSGSALPVGQVVFPERTPVAGGPPRLWEGRDDPQMGMPGGRDLDGDGVIAGEIGVSDYEILPVRVLLQWRSTKGRQRLAVNVLMSPR